jgi:hypothetical protein
MRRNPIVEKWWAEHYPDDRGPDWQASQPVTPPVVAMEPKAKTTSQLSLLDEPATERVQHFPGLDDFLVDMLIQAKGATREEALARIAAASEALARIAAANKSLEKKP